MAFRQTRRERFITFKCNFALQIFNNCKPGPLTGQIQNSGNPLAKFGYAKVPRTPAHADIFVMMVKVLENGHNAKTAHDTGYVLRVVMWIPVFYIQEC